MQRYSFFRLARQALSGHAGWQPAWRNATLASRYDVVIVGGGGHGLATAYYLAKNHGVRRIAVLEKGWIGGGNTGRNTQTIRSNYFYPASLAFYERSLRLYEGLSAELNFNMMLRQRSLISLAHSEHDLEIGRRRVNAMRLNGVQADCLSAREIMERVPLLNPSARFRILGGFEQQRGGIVRHDAVVWGYARAASALGVDIIQGCEVQGFGCSGDRIHAVQTSAGRVDASRVVLCVAGHSSVLGRVAGMRLPLSIMALQAFATEPVKPVLDQVVVSAAVHAYVTQSDRGELVIGAGADGYNSYAQRGGHAQLRATVCALLELFPAFSRLRLMRQWAGTVDVTPDTSPIMGLTPIRGLYISCGWGTGGFKAIPVGGETLAYTVANDRPHPLIRNFCLERFASGALIDEAAAAGVAH